MKKYKLQISGRGAECYIFPITQDQKEKLGELDLNNPDSSDIEDILEKDDIHDTDETYLGAYNDPKLYSVKVIDENEEVVWESKDDHSFDEYVWINKCYDGDYLVIEDYIKGDFYIYDFECEEFDPQKLVFEVVDINEQIELITNLSYDDQDISDTKEEVFYSYKGLTYNLIENSQED